MLLALATSLSATQGWFTLSYSRLEQEFVEQAYLLATKRGWAYENIDQKEAQKAYAEASSISSKNYTKSATWAKQARQMTTDPTLLLEIDQAVSKTASLSKSRQAIMHYFDDLGDEFALILPARYVRAVPFTRPKKSKNGATLMMGVPTIHHYTARQLRQLDDETNDLLVTLDDLGFRLTQDFYRFLRQEKG